MIYDKRIVKGIAEGSEGQDDDNITAFVNRNENFFWIGNTLEYAPLDILAIHVFEIIKNNVNELLDETNKWEVKGLVHFNIMFMESHFKFIEDAMNRYIESGNDTEINALKAKMYREATV